jgi:predicted transcriptional regulator
VKSKTWTFLSNHGRVFAYLARNQNNTTQVMAQEFGLSIRAIQKIITDLEKNGYIDRKKVGRRNNYSVHPELPMRHHMESIFTVGEMLLNHQSYPDE